MPVSVESVSRRGFLKASLLVGAATLFPSGVTLGASEVEPPLAGHDYLALLSDTHVSGSAVAGLMASRLSTAIRQVLALSRRPQKVLFAGDCAHLKGTRGDYREFVRRIEPLIEAGLPLHMALANHDHRLRFWDALPRGRTDTTMPAPRQTMVVPGQYADWYLLDSLNQDDPDEAELGRDQLDWLAGQLDARSPKPAVIMLHHDVARGGGKPWLNDSAMLLALAEARPQVKAIFLGHMHVWSTVQRPSGLHLVNLPATGYTLFGRSFLGWVGCALDSSGATLRVHALGARDQRRHDQMVRLNWRQA